MAQQQQEVKPSLQDVANNRPVIAVLAQLDKSDKKGRSYIAASYIKYLESSGARVVPVPVSATEQQVDEIFNGVNGVLFPGGGVKWDAGKPDYYSHAIRFMDKAKTANDKGDIFPVWGTCLGFETLHVIEGGEDPDILSHRYQAEDISVALDFQENPRGTKIFKDCPEDILTALAKEKITYNHHQAGVSPDTYKSNTNLSGFFNIVSTNKDLAGKLFVSTIEAKNYPIYGTQWHPEKNNFEFNTNLEICHTSIAVLMTQYMSNFFVNQARKNQHEFASEERLQELLIYNYSPVYTGKTDGAHKNFEQCYMFD